MNPSPLHALVSERVLLYVKFLKTIAKNSAAPLKIECAQALLSGMPFSFVCEFLRSNFPPCAPVEAIRERQLNHFQFAGLTDAQLHKFDRFILMLQRLTRNHLDQEIVDLPLPPAPLPPAPLLLHEECQQSDCQCQDQPVE